MKNILRKSVRLFFGKLLPRVPYRVVKGPLKGTKFILGSLSGEGGGATVYFNLIEPLQTQAFVQNIKKGNVVFDVGANVGYYTVLGSLLAGKSGKIFSFEPLVRNVSYLYRHVEINRLSNVNIIPCACSDSLSLVSFFQGSNIAMGHIEGAGTENGSSEEGSVIPTIDLDAVAVKMNIRPDVLKIDVEGAELSVLKGAKTILSTNHPVVFLSVHSNNLKTDCLAYLGTFGYTFTALEEDAETAMEWLCVPGIAKN